MELFVSSICIVLSVLTVWAHTEKGRTAHEYSEGQEYCMVDKPESNLIEVEIS